MAFDWACKVAAVLLGTILLVAIFTGAENFWIITLPAAETTIDKIFQWVVAISFGLVLIVLTCRAALVAMNPRAKKQNGLWYVPAVWVVVSIALPALNSTSAWGNVDLYSILAVTILVSIRLSISELPMDWIDISLKDGAKVNWTGLTHDQSQQAQKELAAAMSEPVTQL